RLESERRPTDTSRRGPICLPSAVRRRAPVDGLLSVPQGKSRMTKMAWFLPIRRLASLPLKPWVSVFLIAVLPPILAVSAFVRPPLTGDALFYGYQLKRAAEVDGRWWKVGADPYLGQPYEPELAKNAGLYEGVDLMLLGALPGRFL